MNERLYRSRRDRMLAGVAGGLAEMWDADPSLVRIVWALLAIFTGGIAFLVYVVMAVVVPEEDDAWVSRPPGTASTGVGESASAPAGAAPPSPSTMPDAGAWAAAEAASRDDRAARRAARDARRAAPGARRGGTSGAVVAGTLLIVVGAFFLVRQYLPAIDFDWVWPLVLVGLGIVLLASAMRRGRDDGGAP